MPVPLSDTLNFEQIALYLIISKPFWNRDKIALVGDEQITSMLKESTPEQKFKLILKLIDNLGKNYLTANFEQFTQKEINAIIEHNADFSYLAVDYLKELWLERNRQHQYKLHPSKAIFILTKDTNTRMYTYHSCILVSNLIEKILFYASVLACVLLLRLRAVAITGTIASLICLMRSSSCVEGVLAIISSNTLKSLLRF